MELFNEYVEISLMIILTSINFIIPQQLQPAYSQESTTTPTSVPQRTLTNSEWFGIFLLIVAVIWGINEYIHNHGKHRQRRSFPAYVREDTIQKQHHKCAICKRGTSVWDFDHKDGNRSNNKSSNCQALCPNCHAKKTRGLLKHKNKFSISWQRVVYIIVILIIIYFILR